MECARMAVSDLQRQIRRGLLGLLGVFRRNNIAIKGFLRLYNDRFAMRDGFATVKNATDIPAPAPTPATPTPAPDDLPLAERIKLSDARNAMLEEPRKQTSRARLQSLSNVYV